MGPQFAAELAAMGVHTNERVARLEEGIHLLRAFWGSEPVSHRGRFYAFDQVQALPKPVQKRIPIIIASNPKTDGDPAVEERVLRRIARLGDGWQTDGTPAAVFRDRWSRIREYAAEAGRAAEVTDASLHMMVNINPDEAQARRESVEFLDRYYGTGVIAPSKIADWLAAGSPAAVADKIVTFIEAGCTTPILRFTSPDQRGQLEQFLERVAPALEGFRSRASAGASAAGRG
jgi:alkanesulfonate monooxygenase SsuD/methylene tetrahydromethanopterin reductase-like flavin-dependent oxidoreductase (luciferase family)